MRKPIEIDVNVRSSIRRGPQLQQPTVQNIGCAVDENRWSCLISLSAPSEAAMEPSVFYLWAMKNTKAQDGTVADKSKHGHRHRENNAFLTIHSGSTWNDTAQFK